MVDDFSSGTDAQIGLWIQAARGGDQEAWKQLHERYRSLLAFTAQAGMPDSLRGRFDADDVLQAVFLAAFRKLAQHEYRGEAAFRAWLKEIARNELADRVRAHQASKRAAHREQAVENPDLLLHAGAEGDTPSQIVSRDQRRAQVLEAMRALADEQQEVLWMRDFEGCTWEEIARRTGCSESSARRRYRLGLETMVRILRRRGLL